MDTVTGLEAQRSPSNGLAFDVVATARSKEKGERIIKSLDPSVRPRVSFVVVPDVAQEGAFDEVLQKSGPFRYVVHTASPYKLHWDDPARDCLDPAIQGTTGLLAAIHAHAPTVQRVIITSSSAAMLSPPNHPPLYNENSWADVTWEQAASDAEHAYRGSKTFAERAAWDFMARHRPAFGLAVINNTYTFGPLPRSLPPRSLAASVNTSNQRIHDLISGKMRSGVHPTAPVFTFVDVRDVALAHVRAMTVPEADGKRFYVVGGYFSNPRIAGIVRRRFRELEAGGWLPPPELAEERDDFPEDHWGFDNSRSKEVLGLEYRGLEESVVDTVASIMSLGAPALAGQGKVTSDSSGEDDGSGIGDRGSGVLDASVPTGEISVAHEA
ncbi:hypothetical protein VTJ83DRAFT_5215 [Remersonia thermophila]|uniref:NAD-dependent epimerase/dehydratase domain-containing protein n=1 Tax=Remersonia thermophila TaxID=72144 RepID=A0ABR4DC63_9PEZI